MFKIDNNLTFSRKRGFDSLKNDNSLTLPNFYAVTSFQFICVLPNLLTKNLFTLFEGIKCPNLSIKLN